MVVSRWHAWLFAALAFVAPVVVAREVIPPAPPQYFNDFAGVVPPAVQVQLNNQLAQFERETSNQVVVAIYPTMASDSSIEDYATRVYQAWHIGQRGKNNGALLLVFTQSHRMRIQTGYGLEGVLPDALCARIMQDNIAPHLRAGDWAGGMQAGVAAMIAAARGEYRGTGRTVAEARQGGDNPIIGVAVVFLILCIMLAISVRQRSQSLVYGRRGRTIVTPWWWGGGGGGGWSSGGGSSWDSGGGGGFSGGFSGGGGSTGGGGASGSW
jgi:uncharacterized protein